MMASLNSQLRKSIFCLKLDNACAHHFTFDIHSLHHNDRYISVVPPKEKVWGGPQSLLSVTPPINSSSTRVFYEAYEVHFEQTLSFIEIIFSYSTCGAKWCQRHVWVWQTIFWSRAKNCQRKTDNIIGMSKITTNIAIIRQIHKCTSEWQCFDGTIIKRIALRSK